MGKIGNIILVGSICVLVLPAGCARESRDGTELPPTGQTPTTNAPDSIEFAPGEVLPFPEPPMGGTVAETMQDSVHEWRAEPQHLPPDAPNILIVMLDDSGFGQDIGEDTNSPVADDYFDRAPFAFTGQILSAKFNY